MTASLDSEAEVRLIAHLPVYSQKSVNFEPAGYPLTDPLFLLRITIYTPTHTHTHTPTHREDADPPVFELGLGKRKSVDLRGIGW
jgi:hypothetical protein